MSNEAQAAFKLESGGGLEPVKISAEIPTLTEAKAAVFGRVMKNGEWSTLDDFPCFTHRGDPFPSLYVYKDELGCLFATLDPPALVVDAHGPFSTLP